jgi:hypothetical protein
LRFANAVGWYNDRRKNERESPWVDYWDYIKKVRNDPFDSSKKWGIPTGGLPFTLR